MPRMEYSQEKKTIDAAPEKRTQKTERRTKATYIEEYFRAQISQGQIETGAFLPAMKILQRRFLASRNTVEKSLLNLCQKQLVEKFGNHYRVHSRYDYSKIKTDCRKVIILGSKESLSASLRRQNAQSLFQTFERELQKGVSFQIEYINNPTEYLQRKRTFTPQSILGVVTFREWIFKHWKISDEYRSELFGNLFGDIKVPCALFIQNEMDESYTTWKSIPAHILPVVQSNYTIGRDVGEYLFARGHRTIGFLSMFGWEPWSVARLNGVKSALNDQCRIQEFSTEFSHADVQEAEFRFQKKTLEILMQCYGRYDVPLYQRWPTNPLSSVIWSEIPRLMEAQKTLQPAFETLLSNKNITVWITADEYVAQAAFYFLQRNNIQVPRRLSIISIDSNPVTMFSQITSYDFDHSSVGYLFAHWLMQDIPIKRTARNFFRMPGRIIERNSVATVHPL